MNLAQLRAFHLVARERGFTRAAAAAGMSQPTLSNHVAALESAYAVRLFERRAREIRLTDLGRMLFDVTTRLFELEDEARALLSGTKTLRRGHLRVAADNAYHAVPILAELRRAHPGLTFRLAVGNSAAVVRQLLDGEVDVAVTAKVVPDPRLHAVEMKQDEIILFVPRTHPWGRLRRVRMDKLDGADLVLREQGSFTREVFEQAVAGAGIRLGTVMEVQTREGVRETVAAGFGIGVVFASEFRPEPRFRALRFADAALSVGEYAVCLAARRHVALIGAFMQAAARSRRVRSRANAATEPS
ncbi:MAG: LysR family transcriptional regulator [Alphaproteobacteria bacterium]|nr:LysR family transcriptional regulator [Alphaproteobacteria bacterium]